MSVEREVVGMLHPGTMGAAVANQAQSSGAQVLWCSAGRSERTRRRAERAGLEAAASLEELLDRSTVVICLCPPAGAEEVSRRVGACGYTGIYVEANAISPQRAHRISPQRAHRIADLLPEARAVLDGAVVGSPPVGGKRPRLLLSGPADAITVVERLFSGTDVLTQPLGNEVGQASALKLAYSSYQKASRVLAAVSYALAAEHGVDEALIEIAGKRAGSYLTETDYIGKTATRAWRWGPEMLEAADLLEASGLPDEVMRAIASVLARWEDCKDRPDLTLEAALAALR